MDVVDPSLRLYGQRALLGEISHDVRLVKIRRDGDRITFTAVCDPPLSDVALNALTIAASEIAADFPDCRLDERITASADPLPKEDVLAEGWLFNRAGG
jgi:hypothetical protein